MAAAKGGFDVKVELFSNDEHPQKEVVAMESKVVPDITYTYSPALWNQNGFAIDIQSLFDEIGKSGGGWLALSAGILARAINPASASKTSTSNGGFSRSISLSAKANPRTRSGMSSGVAIKTA